MKLRGRGITIHHRRTKCSFTRARLHFSKVKYEQEKSWFTSKHEMYSHLDAEESLSHSRRIRDNFLQTADLKPPKTLRLIDCELTAISFQEERVHLIDWYEGLNYTAVSHTWGMQVYEAFDCACATKSLNVNGAAGNHSTPRFCTGRTCPQDPYAGRPMAPIRHNGADVESRWHTRVWTVQEGALSRRRRYCIRKGHADLSTCQSLEEFQVQLAKCYDDATSEVVVIEERQFLTLLVELLAVLKHLMFESPARAKLMVRTESLARKAWDWIQCIDNLLDAVRRECIEFPTFAGALAACSRRSSKHAGDRMNSILTLAGVQDFVAVKDFENVGEMEAAIIEFFKRQGTQGLATAVFSTNVVWGQNTIARHGMQHSWVPNLTRQLFSPDCAMVVRYINLTQAGMNAYERAMDELQQELQGAYFQVLPNGNLGMSRCYWGLVKLVCYCQHNFELERRIPVTELAEEAAELQAIPMVLFATDTVSGSAAYDILDSVDCSFGDVFFLSPPPHDGTTLHACLAFPARSDNQEYPPPPPRFPSHLSRAPGRFSSQLLPSTHVQPN